MKEVTVRKSKREDMKFVIKLIQVIILKINTQIVKILFQELAEFENMPNRLEINAESNILYFNYFTQFYFKPYK